ncbi:MAG TPA: RDD family protein [Burkholderiaceae bacterium]|nr:RDD family protein [Burkholderiaceae bacterium]
MSRTLENTSAKTPALWRRLAAGVSELVLLFGVLMISGYLYFSLTQQRNALGGRQGLMLFEFLVLGVYFGWFWSHGGQTVAMKAWHIRLVGADGRAVPEWRAVVRYLLSYVWFLPSLAALHFASVPRTLGTIFGALALNVALWAGLSRLHPHRQFWHDALCGTRLIDWRTLQRA